MASANWISVESQQAEKTALYQITLVLLGIIFWEVVMSLKFDIDFIRRRRPVTSATLLYWATKLATLLFFVAVNIEGWREQYINCNAVEAFINTSAGVAMGGASGLLMHRALTLWRWDLRVVIPTIVLHLGQWALYLHYVILVREVWVDIGGGKMACIPRKVVAGWVEAQFVYTMCFDFIVLCLATTALLRMPGRSTLWNSLMLDGLIYFVIAFLTYLTCVVVAFSGLGPYVTFICWDVATVAATTVACRSFVRMSTRSNERPRMEPGTLHTIQPGASTGFEFAPMTKGPVQPALASINGDRRVHHVQAVVTFDPDSSFKQSEGSSGDLA